MYKRCLLASDGTKASLVALREGTLISQAFGASAHLLVIDAETPTTRIAHGYYALQPPLEGQELVELGLARLKQLGVKATGELARGEPLPLIVDSVRRLDIDLIVLGPRKRSLLDRWWSGPDGGYIVDNVPCIVLVARDTVSDEEFERHLRLWRKLV